MTVDSSVKKIFFIGIMFLLAAGLVAARPVSGVITYIDGVVDVYRDGGVLDWRMVDIGFSLEEFDLIETGPDGIVEIEMTMPSGSTTTVSVQQDTTFYFEMEAKGAENQTSFQMLSGTLAFKVQKLTGRDSMNVKTESAVMGVRGTQFEIVTSPEGSILVLCDEGSVSCKDTQGREQLSAPGRVVEKVPNERINAFAVDVNDLGIYREYWVSARDEVFKQGADTFIKAYAEQYITFMPKFRAAFDELMKEKSTLERYGRNAQTANAGTLFTVKAEVSPGIVKMRSILPIFEMIFYRLKELEKYHESGIGKGMIRKDYSSDQFFSSFAFEKENIESRMAEVRYLFKLYNVIHNATGGGPSIIDAPISGGRVPTGNAPTPKRILPGN